MAEKAEMTVTTSGNQETGKGARLNSVVRWLRGKKRPAEVPPGELKTKKIKNKKYKFIPAEVQLPARAGLRQQPPTPPLKYRPIRLLYLAVLA